MQNFEIINVIIDQQLLNGYDTFIKKAMHTKMIYLYSVTDGELLEEAKEAYKQDTVHRVDVFIRYKTDFDA